VRPNLNGRLDKLEDRVGRSLHKERALIYLAMNLLDEAEQAHDQASLDLHEQGMALLASIPFDAFMEVSDAEIARLTTVLENRRQG
jgi:hypothetical protein